jgi:hypothetical protein
MAAKHSASPTSYRAFFHGLGRGPTFVPDHAFTGWCDRFRIVTSKFLLQLDRRYGFAIVAQRRVKRHLAAQKAEWDEQ